MLKAYKYRLYPNEGQRRQFAKTFGCCRFVYNQTLAYRKDTYEQEKKSLSKTDCNNYCNRELKSQYEWLKEVDKFALTNAIYNMDSAYKKFFKEHAGYPKFKSKHDNQKSYTTDGDKYENPKTLRKYEKLLIKLQRQLAHKKKGSSNYHKLRTRIAKCHEKIANIRKDYLHRISLKIVNDNQVIVTENLQVQNMMKNHHLAKSVADASWNEFTRQLA